MKKIVFLISRSNDLRFYGPIIDYFNLKKKLYIEFWYYETDLKNYNFKKYLNPLNLNTSLKKNIKIIDLKNTKNLKDYILKNHENISYFFSLTFLSKERISFSSDYMNLIAPKWCVICHGMDSITQFQKENILYSNKTNFFFISKFMFSFAKKWLHKFGKKNFKKLTNSKIYYVGNAMYSKKIFKKKFSKKNKVVYLPFPYLKERYSENKDFSFQASFTGNNINLFDFYKRYHDRSFIYSLFMHIKHIMVNNFEIFKNYKKVKKYYENENEEKIIKSIKLFCDRNNLEFISKPRLKFPFNDKLKKYAKIIYDDESKNYPTVLQEELSKSSLVVGSLSSAVFESVMFNVPYVNISIPNIAFTAEDDKYWYNYSYNSYYNYKGVVFNYNIKDFIENFKDKKLSNFKIDQKRRKTYLKHFCGIEKNSNISIGEQIYKILKL